MLPTIFTVPLLQLASGDRLFLQVYKFIGARPGKKVYLQSNLHGAEIAGNAVLHQLIEYLMSLEASELAGEIWLVPVCNPLGVSQRTHHFSTGRFNIYDGQDWNRIFWNYEDECQDLARFAQSQINLDPLTVRRNYLQQIKASFEQLLVKIQAPSSVPFSDSFRYKLQSLCLDADYVIDLHTSTNQGLDYLYYFQGQEESARFFLLDYGILLDQLDEHDENAFDEAFVRPWLALEDSFRQLGRDIRFDVEAWTLELGSGMQLNPSSVSRGLAGIKNYLQQKGVLVAAQASCSDVVSSHTMTYSQRSQVVKYYAPVGGMIQARTEVGASVQVGEQLYQILSFNKDEKLPTIIPVCAEQAGVIYDVSLNHAVNEGEYVLATL